MRFVDLVTIDVKAGDGGRGCVSLHREKYKPKGGPDGGDGGRGGNVIARASLDLSTLLDFKYHPINRADNGRMGGGNNRHGRDGYDLVLRVPVGTIIRDADTGEVSSPKTGKTYDLIHTPLRNADGSISALGGFMSVTSAKSDERNFRFALRLTF